MTAAAQYPLVHWVVSTTYGAGGEFGVSVESFPARRTPAYVYYLRRNQRVRIDQYRLCETRQEALTRFIANAESMAKRASAMLDEANDKLTAARAAEVAE